MGMWWRCSWADSGKDSKVGLEGEPRSDKCERGQEQRTVPCLGWLDVQQSPPPHLCSVGTAVSGTYRAGRTQWAGTCLGSMAGIHTSRAANRREIGNPYTNHLIPAILGLLSGRGVVRAGKLWRRWPRGQHVEVRCGPLPQAAVLFLAGVRWLEKGESKKPRLLEQQSLKMYPFAAFHRKCVQPGL